MILRLCYILMMWIESPEFEGMTAGNARMPISTHVRNLGVACDEWLM